MRSVPVIEHYFSIPDSEEIYFSFVGEDVFETFYFVYKKIDSSTAGVVCRVIDEECVEFDVPSELHDLEIYDSYDDDFQEAIVVYSSLNLVSLTKTSSYIIFNFSFSNRLRCLLYVAYVQHTNTNSKALNAKLRTSVYLFSQTMRILE